MFTRAMYETDDMIEQHKLLNEIANRIDAGKLRTTLAKRMSPIHAASLREAHRLIESGCTIQRCQRTSKGAAPVVNRDSPLI